MSGIDQDIRLQNVATGRYMHVRGSGSDERVITIPEPDGDASTWRLELAPRDNVRFLLKNKHTGTYLLDDVTFGTDTSVDNAHWGLRQPPPPDRAPRMESANIGDIVGFHNEVSNAMLRGRAVPNGVDDPHLPQGEYRVDALAWNMNDRRQWRIRGMDGGGRPTTPTPTPSPTPSPSPSSDDDDIEWNFNPIDSDFYALKNMGMYILLLVLVLLVGAITIVVIKYSQKG